jgi:hypothetical protein
LDYDHALGWVDESESRIARLEIGPRDHYVLNYAIIDETEINRVLKVAIDKDNLEVQWE